MKNYKYLVLATFLLYNNYAQTGGGVNFNDLFKNSSVIIGFNQSFYGEDWKDFEEELEDSDLDLTKTPYRKINFTLMNEFEHGLLGGVKYLSYGYDIDFDGTMSDGTMTESSYSLDLKFLKLFITYPMGSGLYFGLEGGYFIEGESKIKFQDTSPSGGVYDENIKTTLDRDDWEDDGDLNSYDYGLLAQYYYTIQNNILFTTELFYSLSEFSEDNSMSISAVPNSFNYLNFGLTYKFKK